MDARTFAEHAPRVYAAAPIRDVELENVAVYPEALASPHLRQIAALSIVQQDLDDSALELLASSPHASRLRMLEVPINRIAMRGLEAICRSPYLRNLRWVSLHGNPIPDPVDEYDMEGDDIVDVRFTELGQQLERRFGLVPWLHAPSYFGGPAPAFEAAADAPPIAPPVKGVGPEYEV